LMIAVRSLGLLLVLLHCLLIPAASLPRFFTDRFKDCRLQIQP
jgi:hypothetical protein